MRTYIHPARMFKSQTTIITPFVGYNFKTALTVHNFHSKGAFLAELPIVAFRQIHTQHILHILPGTHLIIHLGGEQQCR